MKNVSIIIGILLLFSSCLKKIDEVETANTNIFDPEYAGDQWWVYDDVYIYTNSNNDQKVRFLYSIPENKAPDLKPTHIDVSISVNGATPVFTQADITKDGNFEGELEINPSGVTNYCLEIGVYVVEEDLTINSFTECKSL
ncbi:MAG: hypothetical protein HUJ25_12785 [Crocinitomicaceae bacterium]|nr:hypothetical protein [Crocinitomicaceae bacterium]